METVCDKKKQKQKPFERIDFFFDFLLLRFFFHSDSHFDLSKNAFFLRHFFQWL